MPFFKTYLSPSGPPVTAFSYAWDPGLLVSGAVTNEVIGTGGMRPLYTTDFGVSIDSMNISGIQVNTDQLETINTSGTQYLAAISGATAHGYTTVSSSTVSGSMSAITTGIGLAANPNRKKFYAQVIGSGGPLWLNYNGVGASSTNWNVALKAASSDPGMDGGTLSDSDFKGAVFVSGYIGARWNLWEGV